MTKRTIEEILDKHAEYYVRQTMKFFQENGKSPALSKNNEGDLEAKHALLQLFKKELSKDDVLDALEAIVTHAAPEGTQDDGDFVGFYVLSTGELHKAIPVLKKYGKFATPLGDPKLKSRYQAHLKKELVAELENLPIGKTPSIQNKVIQDRIKALKEQVEDKDE